MAGCMELYGNLRPNPDVEKIFYDKKQLPFKLYAIPATISWTDTYTFLMANIQTL
jgi:hypothetical protein